MSDGLIQVLSENLINKIAAGEVIDRPSSVVKELVENSIDAGSTEISVILKNGGKGLIQVIDNGKGMSEQDAIMSFQRHATSKIRAYEDVEAILTLGFRGEALASIASVARVELKTVPQGQIDGTLLTIENGIINNVTSTGGNAGTSISVKTLFYNTPARRKFMRADSTEYRHILTVVNRFALCYPSIAFKCVHDDNEVFDLKPEEPKQRVANILGDRIADSLVEVDDNNAICHITGFIGNTDLHRKSRNEQYLFVNKRHISDKTISAAIMSGYGETIPRGTFPLYVLNFDIEPDRVDVNVHPTKSEIKFADSQVMFSVVRGAIKRSISTDDIVPNLASPDMVASFKTNNPFRKKTPANLLDEIKSSSTQQTRIDFDTPLFSSHDSPDEPTPQSSGMSYGLDGQQESKVSSPKEEKMLWQLHNKYLVSQIKSGLVLIDQHAAHERVIYEKVKSYFDNNDAASQTLLFPQTIDFSVEDFQYIIEMVPLLKKMGFVLKGFGARTIVLEGVPIGMRFKNEEKILLEILDEYKLKLGTEVDMQERVAKSVACRSAIMTGDPLTDEEMTTLIDQLFACETPYFCPHGRPTMITLSLEELDTRFERT